MTMRIVRASSHVTFRLGLAPDVAAWRRQPQGSTSAAPIRLRWPRHLLLHPMVRDNRFYRRQSARSAMPASRSPPQRETMIEIAAASNYERHASRCREPTTVMAKLSPARRSRPRLRG